jgi:hypothetical protein
MVGTNGNGNGHDDLPLFRDMIALPGNFQPPPYVKEKIPEELWRQVMARDELTCQECGGRADTLDHIYPESRGGRTELDNLRALCRSCNSRKGARVEPNLFPLRKRPPSDDGAVGVTIGGSTPSENDASLFARATGRAIACSFVMSINDAARLILMEDELALRERLGRLRATS